MKRKTGEQTYTRATYAISCDRCGAAIEAPRGYKVDEFKLERWVGKVFPEDSLAWTHGLDCCAACWPFLVSALEGVGFTFWHRNEDGEDSHPEAGWELAS